MRLLVDAGADTESKFGIIGNAGDVEYGGTILTLANRVLRTKKVDGKNATQEQLNGLEDIRRLLIIRVEAVHAVSWLWHTERAVIARVFYVSSKSTMMPILRRIGRQGLAFSWSQCSGERGENNVKVLYDEFVQFSARSSSVAIYHVFVARPLCVIHRLRAALVC